MGNCEILLSVIIPVYNGEKYIEETVKSVINQPCKNVEVILVNDGSNDQSDRQCKLLESRYSNIRYYEKTNEGIGKTRNFGLRYAKGKYVNFLDQDDLWVQGVFDNTIEGLLKDSVDVIGFSMCSTNENMTRGKYRHVVSKDLFGGGLEVALSSWMHHSSFMFNRAFINEFNLKYPCTRHEDEIFRYMCLYASKHVRYIDVPLFYYRNNPESETHRKYEIEQMFGPMLQSYEELIKWHEHNHPRDLAAINFCERMKCIYSIEAIELLYKQGLSENEIKKIRDRICPQLLKKYTKIELSNRTFSKIYEYENKRSIFCLKNRIKGIALKVGKFIVKNQYIRKMYEFKKYPIKLERRIFEKYVISTN